MADNIWVEQFSEKEKENIWVESVRDHKTWGL